MPSVWYCVPTAAPLEQAAACLDTWRKRGYGVAILFEDPARMALPYDLGYQQDKYSGYAASVNKLAAAVLEEDPDCQWIVTGGDDVYPDLRLYPDQIATRLDLHFQGTLGVMQPTGHSSWSAETHRIAWSPWMGRKWCRRSYEGHGPLWSAYHHFWVDADLHAVAAKLGLLLSCADITHFHDTWKRREPRVRPDHLLHVTDFSLVDRQIFERRDTQGFPNSGLL